MKLAVMLNPTCPKMNAEGLPLMTHEEMKSPDQDDEVSSSTGETLDQSSALQHRGVERSVPDIPHPSPSTSFASIKEMVEQMLLFHQRQILISANRVSYNDNKEEPETTTTAAASSGQSSTAAGSGGSGHASQEQSHSPSQPSTGKRAGTGLIKPKRVYSHISSDPNQACVICGGKASGLHFGVYSCESCKLFFLRVVKQNLKIECPLGGNCDISPRERSKCRGCRFRKCQEAGMARDKVIFGRNARAVAAARDDPTRLINQLSGLPELSCKKYRRSTNHTSSTASSVSGDSECASEVSSTGALVSRPPEPSQPPAAAPAAAASPKFANRKRLTETQYLYEWPIGSYFESMFADELPNFPPITFPEDDGYLVDHEDAFEELPPAKGSDMLYETQFQFSVNPDDLTQSEISSFLTPNEKIRFDNWIQVYDEFEEKWLPNIISVIIYTPSEDLLNQTFAIISKYFSEAFCCESITIRDFARLSKKYPTLRQVLFYGFAIPLSLPVYHFFARRLKRDFPCTIFTKASLTRARILKTLRMIRLSKFELIITIQYLTFRLASRLYPEMNNREIETEKYLLENIVVSVLGATKRIHVMKTLQIISEFQVQEVRKFIKG